MRLFRGKHRAELRQKPWPTRWRNYVAQNVPYYHVLSDDDRAELEGLVNVFVDEKRFEGCNGLDVTEDLKREGISLMPYRADDEP